MLKPKFVKNCNKIKTVWSKPFRKLYSSLIKIFSKTSVFAFGQSANDDCNELSANEFSNSNAEIASWVYNPNF